MLVKAENKNDSTFFLDHATQQINDGHYVACRSLLRFLNMRDSGNPVQGQTRRIQSAAIPADQVQTAGRCE